MFYFNIVFYNFLKITNVYNIYFLINIMLNSNRALQGHIISLFLVSIIVGLLLSLTLTQIYGEDNQKCQEVLYEVKDICKKDSSVEFNLKNDYTSVLDFKINDKRDVLNYRLDSGEEKKLIVRMLDKNVLVLVPIIKDAGKNFECSGKVKKINTEVLIKC